MYCLFFLSIQLIHNILISQGIGDINLAYRCFRLALVSNNDHSESYNNLGVLEYRRGNLDTARAFFMTSSSLAPHMFQPFYNHATLANKVIKSNFFTIKFEELSQWAKEGPV